MKYVNKYNSYLSEGSLGKIKCLGGEICLSDWKRERKAGISGIGCSITCGADRRRERGGGGRERGREGGVRGGPGVEKEKGAVLVWREREISPDPEGFTLFWSV